MRFPRKLKKRLKKSGDFKADFRIYFQAEGFKKINRAMKDNSCSIAELETMLKQTLEPFRVSN